MRERLPYNLVEEWWLCFRRVLVTAATADPALLDDGICDDLAPAILRRRG